MLLLWSWQVTLLFSIPSILGIMFSSFTFADWNPEFMDWKVTGSSNSFRFNQMDGLKMKQDIACAWIFQFFIGSNFLLPNLISHLQSKINIIDIPDQSPSEVTYNTAHQTMSELDLSIQALHWIDGKLWIHPFLFFGYWTWLVFFLTTLDLSVSCRISWLEGEPPGTRTLAAHRQKRRHWAMQLPDQNFGLFICESQFRIP